MAELRKRRARLQPQAVAMAGEKLTQREIARRLGVTPSCIGQWLRDPDGSKMRRTTRLLYEIGKRPCERCGKPAVVAVCQQCQAPWPPERIVRALQDWAREHGGPPTSTDWKHAGEMHPSLTTVQVRFGSWNAGLTAAGLPTRAPGKRRWRA